MAICAVAQAFFGVRVSDNVARARDAARKALAIDPREGAAYGALGLVELCFDWGFAAARADLKARRHPEPHNGMIRHSYADYLMIAGRIEESLEQVRWVGGADPQSALLQLIVLQPLAAGGQFG